MEEAAETYAVKMQSLPPARRVIMSLAAHSENFLRTDTSNSGATSCAFSADLSSYLYCWLA
jgi:hypothetical protein